MDVNKIWDEGGYMIPNLKYDKKDKKSTEPKYILSADPNLGKTGAMEALSGAVANSEFMGDTRKVQEYGITPYRGMDMQSILAREQSNWAKVFNSLGQTLVSEIGVGTLKAGADLFGFIGSKLGATDDPYHNALSNMFADWQNYLTEEAMPIYVKPGEDISNGGLGDVGWYAKNFPSVASSLTLLIPSRAATGGISKLIKGLKLNKASTAARKYITQASKLNRGKELNRFQKAINNPINIERGNKVLETASDALFMRTMENYQDAGDVHTQTYQDASNILYNMDDATYQQWVDKNKNMFEGLDIDFNNRDEVAKGIAKKAADKTFGMDFSNVVFDFIQLWALKDIGAKKFNVKGKGITEAQENSIKDVVKYAAEKSGKQLDDVIKKESTTAKFFKPVKYFVQDFGKLIASESTEGIEEMVNYVAQQEGITYGKMLLEGLAEKDDRGVIENAVDAVREAPNLFKNYMNDAELWEQAFWGVAGGVVFGGFASLHNKHRLYKANKRHKELKEAMDINDDYDKDFMSLFDTSETKAAKEAIRKKIAHVQRLKDDIDAIKNDKNIYAPKDDKGQYQEFKGDVELQKAASIARRIGEFRAAIAKDAINSGTFDLTREYFQSEEVKQAMIDLGITTKDDADTFVNQTLSDLDVVKNVYANQSSIVNAQATELNASKQYKENIPIEYIRMIASENTNQLLTVRTIDGQIAALDDQIADKEKILKDNGVDTSKFQEEKENIKLGALSDLYGRLEADKKYLKEHGNNTIASRIEIKSIEDQQKGIADQILSLSRGTESMLFTLRQAKTFEKLIENDADGNSKANYYINKNAEVFKQTDSELIKEYEDLLNPNKSPLEEDRVNALSQVSKVLEQNVKNINNSELYKNHKDLFDTYVMKNMAELNKANVLSHVATTTEQVKNSIDLIHTRLNEARLKAIDVADNTFLNLYNQYKDVDEGKIETALYEASEGNRQEAEKLVKEFMKPEDVEKFFSAIDVFKFTQASNSSIYFYVQAGIDRQKELDAAERKKTTTSENAQEITDNSNTDNSPQTDKTKPVGSVSEEINNLNNQNQSESEQNVSRRTISIETNPTNDTTTIIDDETGVPAIQKQDGTIEIDLKNNNVPGAKLQELFDSGFVDIDNNTGLPIFEQGLTIDVVKNPILRQNDKSVDVLQKGEVRVRRQGEVEENVEEEVEENAEENGREIPPAIPAESSEEVKKAAEENHKELEENLTKEADEIEMPNISPIGDENEEVEENNAEVKEITIAPTNNENQIPTEFVEEPQIDELTLQVKQEILNIVKNPLDPNIDFEDVKRQLKETIVDDNYTQDEIDNIINQQIAIMKNGNEAFKRIMAKQNNSESDRLNIAGAEVAMYARFENPDDRFSDLFKLSIEDFINKYIATTYLPEIDGKQVIRLSDILTIVKNAFDSENNQIALDFYNVVKAYLYNKVSDPDNKARDKYIILDEDDIRSGEIIDKILGREPKNDYDTFDNLSVRSYFDYYANQILKSGNPSDIAILNSIKLGEKLTIKQDGDDFYITKNGLIIARLPVPKIVPETGELISFERGWIFRSIRDSNGIVQSPLKNYILNIFSSNSEDAIDLRKIIVEASIKGYTPDIIKRFENNNIINNERKRSLDASSRNNLIFARTGNDGSVTLASSEELLKHLVNISVNYLQNTKGSLDKNRDAIIESITDWFDKYHTQQENILDRCYDGATVEVSNVKQGELIRNKVSTARGDVTYEDHLFPSEAIGDNSDFKITVVQNGIGYSSGMPVMETGFEKINTFSTLICHYDANNHPYYTNAVGCKCNDAESPIMQQLVSASCSYLESLLRENINAKLLIKELSKIIAFGNDLSNETIPLFRGFKGSFKINEVAGSNGNAISITFTEKVYNIDTNTYEPKHYNFNIYTRSKTYGPDNYHLGVQIKGYNNVGEYVLYEGSRCPDMPSYIAKVFGMFLAKHANFNIDKRGIDLDNTNFDRTLGFFSKKDGNVVLDIPTMKVPLSLGTYNDLLLNMNLIKVNLKKNEQNSNFARFTQNNLQNQVLFVNLPTRIQPSMPDSSQYVHVNSTDPIFVDNMNKAKDILEDDSNENKTQTIVDTFLDEEDRKAFDELLANYPKDENHTIFDIIPKYIKYDAKMNTYAEATALTPAHWVGGVAKSKGSTRNKNLKKDTAYVGTWWLNMIASTNKDKRKEAIGKLIHEALHNSLAKDQKVRKELLESVEDVYNQFINRVKQEQEILLNKKDRTKDDNKYLQIYSNIIQSVTSPNTKLGKIEEFFVESITNKNWYDLLNAITVEDVGTGKSETLWSKLLEILRKFFGYDKVNDNSLLQKELNILRNLGDTSEMSEVNNNENEDISQPPIEENNEILSTNEPNQPNNGEGILDMSIDENGKVVDIKFDEDDEFENNDDETYALTESEQDVKIDLKFENSEDITTIPTVLRSIPFENRDNFKKIIDNGYYNIKCN